MAEYAVLAKNNKDLLNEIFSILTDRVKADPYSDDGSYAAAIRQLPTGLRAMAATHHLDVSLTLDDLGWHFLNFGEPGLVQEAGDGLRELGLPDVAQWFEEAQQIVQPLLDSARKGEIKSPGDEYYDGLERSGNRPRMDQLSQLAQDKSTGCSEDASGSFIYDSWIKYCRMKPENVFDN
ncbi:MAG: hypothetical protein JOY54_14705 [Acidobacteriaceae bacterium]|nr:hypothetical protein [Acidobacteriaceae bacterium]